MAMWVTCGAAGNANVGTGSHGMVASVHPIATDAGVAAMRAGGNAIDAAVATALTLGVVDGHNSGIGGGCFLLARLADGTFIAIDGRETAPAAATADMFIVDGKADVERSQTGPLASGVPGTIAVYSEATRRWGKKSLAELLEPAAIVAERGFPLDVKYAAKLEATTDKIARFPGSRAVLLKPDGSPYKEGEVLRQPDLARTYRSLAADGTNWFYRGEFARTVSQWMASNGGVLTEADFARYEVKHREPLRTTYRDYTIIGMPPPSSGGIHVAQMLTMLERFDLAQLERENPASRIHVTAEAMKLAFADRAYWLGDPDFARVPRGLIDPVYLQGLAKNIDPIRVTPVASHGTPDNADQELFGKHTTHIAAVDDEGNWVAITATVNTAFGSKVIVPGTGVILNNEMDDFATQAGVPNAFKLVGGDANAVAPFKRPLSSMSPTIVLKDDKPVLTVGAAGGPRIITQVLLAITNRLTLGDSPDASLARPRFHQQWSPDVLAVEDTMPRAIVSDLEARGHTIQTIAAPGATQMILLDADGKSFVGVSEPRVPGKAAGY